MKRWLKTPEGVKPAYRRQGGDTKIAPYAAQLEKALEVDTQRPKRDRRTALKLFGEIQGAGFTGDYSRVTEFVRRWRAQGGQAKVNAFIPLKFEPGEAFQFDWSEEHLVIGGVWRKVLAAHLKFCASRAFVVSAYPTQGHEMLFDAHTPASRLIPCWKRLRLDAGGWDTVKCAPPSAGVSRPNNGQVAQLVEQRIENPRVDGSIPPLATKI